jgi:Flp pilus assembly protein TadB
MDIEVLAAALLAGGAALCLALGARAYLGPAHVAGRLKLFSGPALAPRAPASGAAARRLRLDARRLRVLVARALPGAAGRRRRALLRALPDAIDLMTISLSAGMGFQGALVEAARRTAGPLREELDLVLRDVQLGTSRREALRALAARCGLDELGNFVAAVLQAEELGSPMRDTLQAQAGLLRQHRRHRAEERARRATILMLVPMVAFIFPALVVVLIGPSVPSFAPLIAARTQVRMSR